VLGVDTAERAGGLSRSGHVPAARARDRHGDARAIIKPLMSRSLEHSSHVLPNTGPVLAGAAAGPASHVPLEVCCRRRASGARIARSQHEAQAGPSPSLQWQTEKQLQLRGSTAYGPAVRGRAVGGLPGDGRAKFKEALMNATASSSYRPAMDRSLRPFPPRATAPWKLSPSPA
jgi:hypothetical protein